MDAGKGTPGKKKGAYLLAFFILPALLCFVYYYFAVRKPLTSGDDSIYVKLLYFGPRQLAPNGKDTIYHTVPPFSFTNQEGKTITDKDYAGMIYVADFFSCSCTGDCSKLAAQYFNLQKRLGFIRNFRLLSHSLDPERDSVAALKYYGSLVHADDSKWNLVRGDRQTVLDLATKGYLVEIVNNDKGEPDHSKTLVLVDRDKHIRGFYNGTSVTEVDRLQDEVRVLYAEYRMKDRKTKLLNK
jgi:protein SCO1/2